MTTIDTHETGTKRSGWHPVNVGHFVMGIAFLGIVLIWILVEADAVTGDDIRWLLPVPWVLAGAAGLVATTRRRRDSEEWRDAAYGAHERGWVGPEPAAERVEERHDAPAYDDLDEKLARAEHESRTRTTATTVAPPEATEPTDPPDPADPADPADPTDPA
jgi:hypothetical protein